VAAETPTCSGGASKIAAVSANTEAWLFESKGYIAGQVTTTEMYDDDLHCRLGGINVPPAHS
jgi:hypothetical protein